MQLCRNGWRASCSRPYVGVLPRQLVHGDFWDNNVRFRDLDIVAVLDLDFMEERPRIDDLALTLYYVTQRSVPTTGRQSGLRPSVPWCGHTTARWSDP